MARIEIGNPQTLYGDLPGAQLDRSRYQKLPSEHGYTGLAEVEQPPLTPESQQNLVVTEATLAEKVLEAQIVAEYILESPILKRKIQQRLVLNNDTQKVVSQAMQETLLHHCWYTFENADLFIRKLETHNPTFLAFTDEVMARIEQSSLFTRI